MLEERQFVSVKIVGMVMFPYLHLGARAARLVCKFDLSYVRLAEGAVVVSLAYLDGKKQRLFSRDEAVLSL